MATKCGKLDDDLIYEYRLIPGLRASSKLLCIDELQQIFKYQYTRNNIKYYYCYQKKCQAGAVVELNNAKYCRLTSKKNIHNHATQSEFIQKLQLVNKFKKKLYSNGTMDNKNENTSKELDNLTENSNKSKEEQTVRIPILKIRQNLQTLSSDFKVIKKEPIFDTQTNNIFEGVLNTFEQSHTQYNNAPHPPVLSTDSYSIMECNSFNNNSFENIRDDVEFNSFDANDNISMMQDQLYEFKIIPGFRATSNLLYIESIQQLFKLKYTRNDNKYYYCYLKNCHAGAILDKNAGYCRLTAKNNIHNHSSPIELIQDLERINSNREAFQGLKSMNSMSKTNVKNHYGNDNENSPQFHNHQFQTSKEEQRIVESNINFSQQKFTIKEEPIFQNETINMFEELSQTSINENSNIIEPAYQDNQIKEEPNVYYENYNDDEGTSHLDSYLSEQELETAENNSLIKNKHKGKVFKCRIIPGLRSTSNLLCVDAIQQIFHYKYIRNNLKYYSCYQKTCNAGAVVELDNSQYCRLTANIDVHSHGPQTEFIKKLELINQNRILGKKSRKKVQKANSKACKKFENKISNEYSESIANVPVQFMQEKILDVPNTIKDMKESIDLKPIEENKIFEYTYIPGFRVSSKLLYIEKTQQIYMFKYIRKNIKYFTCYVKKCGAGVVVDVQNTKYCRLAGKNHIHTHDPQIRTIEKLKCINSKKDLKRKSKSNKSSLQSSHEETLFEYEIIKGFRGKSTLLYIKAIQQVFKLHHTKNTDKYYYCYAKNCNITAVVNENNSQFCRIIAKTNVHKHGLQTKLIRKLQIIKTKLRNIENDERNTAGNSLKIKNNALEEPEIFEYKLIQGLRASSTLLYIPLIQQLFRLQYHRKNFSYYYCYEKNCNVGVVVEAHDSKYCRLSARMSVHNHGPQNVLLNKLNTKYSNIKDTKIESEMDHIPVLTKEIKSYTAMNSQTKSTKSFQCILWCDIERKLLTHPRSHFKSCQSCYEKMKKIDEETTTIVNDL